MPRRVHRLTTPALPPVFSRIIQAAKHVATHDTTARSGHALALEELSAWAILNVPVRGVLAPQDDAAFRAIQAIAARHLGYADASQAFRRALKGLGNTDARHEIEATANHLQSISDDAYYYAGLACGITLMNLDSSRR